MEMMIYRQKAMNSTMKGQRAKMDEKKEVVVAVVVG
jgi:hypothetical protein